jgi:hypothetical protein
MGVGQKDESREFFINDLHDGTSSFLPGRAQALRHNRKCSVAVTSLDSYIERKQIDPADVAVIKIDAEGFEPEILRGAACLLTENSPLVIIENDEEVEQQRADGCNLLELLASYGFKFFVPVGGFLEVAEGRCSLDRYQALNLYHKSVVAVKTEHTLMKWQQ